MHEINGKETKIKFQEELEIYYLDITMKIDNVSFKFDIYRKKAYTNLSIPEESYHPIGQKLAALNSFCYRAMNYLADAVNMDAEIK